MDYYTYSSYSNYDAIFHSSKPKFGEYQLLGDSLFVRFSEQTLNLSSKYVNGSRCIDYCVSGQRIDQLRQKIKAQMYPLSSKVLVLIGTNDMLCGNDIKVMIRHFTRLLKMLKQCEKVLILTLPPIPRLCVNFDHWITLRQYNNFLKSLDNGKNIVVADITQLFIKCDWVMDFAVPSFPKLKKRKKVEGRQTMSALDERKSSSSPISQWLEKRKDQKMTQVDKLSMFSQLVKNIYKSRKDKDYRNEQEKDEDDKETKRKQLKRKSDDRSEDENSSTTSDGQSRKSHVVPKIDQEFLTMLQKNKPRDRIEVATMTPTLKRRKWDNEVVPSPGIKLNTPPFRPSNTRRASWPLQGMKSRDSRLVDLSGDICRLECFELYYAPNTRLDLIHLNLVGFKKLRTFLINQNFVSE